MIRLDHPQGSPEWKQARLGVVTASQFHRILTPKTRKPSTQAEKYMHELIAEWWTGEPQDDAASQFMQRGTELEAEAVSYYEFQRTATEPAGFLLRDDGKVGASPDRIVNADGAVEIKCLSAAHHVAALLGETDDSYLCQVQGQMWIGGFRWIDRVWYNPSLPSVILRVERDDEFIAQLSAAVDQFVARLDETKAELSAKFSIDNQAALPIIEA